MPHRKKIKLRFRVSKFNTFVTSNKNGFVACGTGHSVDRCVAYKLNLIWEINLLNNKIMEE